MSKKIKIYSNKEIVSYLNDFTKKVFSDLPSEEEIKELQDHIKFVGGFNSKTLNESHKKTLEKITKANSFIDYEKTKDLIYKNKKEMLDFLDLIEENKNENLKVIYTVREEFSINSTIIKNLNNLEKLISFYEKKDSRIAKGFTDEKLNDHFCNIVNFNYDSDKIILNVTPLNFKECFIMAISAKLQDKDYVHKFKKKRLLKEILLNESLTFDETFNPHIEALLKTFNVKG